MVMLGCERDFTQRGAKWVSIASSLANADMHLSRLGPLVG